MSHRAISRTERARDLNAIQWPLRGIKSEFLDDDERRRASDVDNDIDNGVERAPSALHTKRIGSHETA